MGQVAYVPIGAVIAKMGCILKLLAEKRGEFARTGDQFVAVREKSSHQSRGRSQICVLRGR